MLPTAQSGDAVSGAMEQQSSRSDPAAESQPAPRSDEPQQKQKRSQPSACRSLESRGAGGECAARGDPG